MGEKESISGMGWGRDIRRLRSFTGDRGVALASILDQRASPGKPRQANGSHASQGLPKPIIKQYNPTSEIMSDELLSNYSNEKPLATRYSFT